MAFINSFAWQQCIIEAGAAPRDMPHHPSKVWQLWRVRSGAKQQSAERAELARRNAHQYSDAL
jgi:hypothetical protein